MVRVELISFRNRFSI